MTDDGVAVLDFGCGSGRTLRHLTTTAWQLSGCDIDAEAIAWSRKVLPGFDLRVTSPEPPLPYGDAAFEVVYAVSVFTHFDRREQIAWRDELFRILAPGGLAVISTMGPSVVENFPRLATPDARRRLSQLGFVYREGDGAFNSNAAFHAPAGLVRLFSPSFSLLLWDERGLDGFQDLSVLQKHGAP
jgi:Methylase involved in ubiquinone/menaquinone biosynthesis